MIPFAELSAALDRFNGREPGHVPAVASSHHEEPHEGQRALSPEDMAALGHAPDGEEILAAGGEPMPEEHASHDEHAQHEHHHADSFGADHADESTRVGEEAPPLPPVVVDSQESRDDTTGEIDVNDLIDG